MFPLFFWLPASYHTPPAPVAALVRTFTPLFAHDPGLIQPLLLGIAALTMVTGVLGAAAQSDVRRILSFHIISQIGYMIMGLALLFSGLYAFELVRSGLRVAVDVLTPRSRARPGLVWVPLDARKRRGDRCRGQPDLSDAENVDDRRGAGSKGAPGPCDVHR